MRLCPCATLAHVDFAGPVLACCLMRLSLCKQAIAPYKNRDPGTDDEVEHAGNLVGALCSCLLLPATRAVFVAGEGVELMLLILKQKRRARTGALKALDFGLVRCVAACERFVDVQGLRTLFPLFMGKSKVSHRHVMLGKLCCASK